MIYGIEDPNEKLEIFNDLLSECINNHAPLKRVKVTRPPAPWLQNEAIRNLQSLRNDLRYEAHLSKSPDIWQKFRSARNLLKRKIKDAKQEFINKALNSKTSKQIWQIIHQILSPCPDPIRFDVDTLNTFFIETATRTTGDVIDTPDDLHQFINDTHSDNLENRGFVIKHVSFHEVTKCLKALRNDTSTGHDHLPVKFLKPIAEIIAGPLTHIINSAIDLNLFPDIWKQARVTPIPKINNPSTENDLRPISILPTLSKIYEKLVSRQIVDFIDDQKLLSCNISGFRKGHSTASTLLNIRDDITMAMKRGEITLLVLADFSKAFDTIKYKTVLTKLSKLGFSKSFLRWTLSYLTNRKQFVQIDDRRSEILTLNFGIPQGSILGPLIFNLYVADLHEHLDAECRQYADEGLLWAPMSPRLYAKFGDIGRY